ncbi:MAG: hypothetical protein JNK02_13765 [Planctomycetes bacterium]|nr:hypothetical protein [Planctomycetota bacterium]
MKPALLLAFLALCAPAQAAMSTPLGLVQAQQPDVLGELRAQWSAAAQALHAQSMDDREYEAKRAELLGRARALLRDDPRGELAVRTRIWVATSGLDRERGREPYYEDLFTKDLASPALGELVEALRPGSGPDARARLGTLVAKAAERSVRGRAMQMLAEHSRRELERLRGVRAGDVKPEALLGEFGAARVAALEELGVDGLEREYVAALERVVKEFGDVLDARGRAIGPRAEGALFEIQRLQIGMLAPDIEGEDIQGVPFKLSDYRGKVIFLDFWGHW